MDPVTLALIGGTVGKVGQIYTNKKSMKFAKEQADIAYSRQLDLYNRMKEDNSPLNRRLQLNEAGLSPALLGGMAGSMGGSASGTSAPQGATPQLKNPLESANLGLTLAQIQNIQANTRKTNIEANNIDEGGINWRNIDADTKKKIEETSTELVKRGYTNALKDLTEQETQYKKTENLIKTATTKEAITKAVYELEQMKESYNKTIAETQKVKAETKTIEAERDLRVELLQEEIYNKTADTALKDANINLTDEKTTQVRQDIANSVKQLGLNYRKLEEVDKEHVKNQLKAIMMEKYKTDKIIEQRQIELIVNSILTVWTTAVKGATEAMKKQ